tara:strand:- start:483 stop:992 length:510 start_codon:yes stop_codon:yes gene_type:complete
MFFGDDVDGIDYMKVIMDQVNSFYNSDDWLPKRLDKKLKSIKEYKDILNKDYNKYYDKVFSYNYSSILNEVYYENDQLVDTDNQIYIDYNKMREFYEEIDDLFYLIEIYLTDYALHSQSLIDAGNSEIIKLSKRENNIIIIAFFLQLIIFCIIQYFEINSIQQARKKNA